MDLKIKIDNDSKSIDQRLEEDDMSQTHNMYDYVKIFELLLISYFLKTMKLFFFILSFSFFSAMVFRIFLGIEHDFFNGVDDFYTNKGDCSNDDAEGYFRHCYQMEDKSMGADLVFLMYYTFTTLSTVGFGDVAPKSNSERIFIAFFMLFGVAIFSYIMGNFIVMIEEFQKMTEEINDGDKLSKFFGAL